MNYKNMFNKIFIVIHIIYVTLNKNNNKILYFGNKKSYIT